jgi:HK97 gp10 family phage protein
MANNESVEKFRQLSKDLQKEVTREAVVALNKAADAIVMAMKGAAARKSGKLAQSIRKEPGKTPTVVKVVAGGAATTERGRHGRPYDYARAVEFGTVKMPAEPFFFSTYRRKKAAAKQAMRQTIIAAINKRSSSG